jgi:Co/Zn/Cd efflux system component
MNMRGVFLHVMADALGSVVVIVSALVMWQVRHNKDF